MRSQDKELSEEITYVRATIRPDIAPSFSTRASCALREDSVVKVIGSNIGPSDDTDGGTTKSTAKVMKEYWIRVTVSWVS